jgi:hypothetical protein
MKAEKHGAAGVHEKSELKKTLYRINFVKFKGTKMSSLIGFRGAFFFCFFSFGRAKEKKEVRTKNSVVIINCHGTISH